MGSGSRFAVAPFAVPARSALREGRLATVRGRPAHGGVDRGIKEQKERRNCRCFLVQSRRIFLKVLE